MNKTLEDLSLRALKKTLEDLALRAQLAGRATHTCTDPNTPVWGRLQKEIATTNNPKASISNSKVVQ